jgi:hypothetical protein
MITHKKLYLEDINTFIAARIKCSDHLDFQLSDNLVPGNDKKELWLSKHISAFTNSGGGTVVFGIKTFRGRASEICGVDFSKASAFWMETLLKNEITPIIENIEVYEIPFSEIKTSGLLVIHIPKSTLRPHMASDKRYYHRIGLRVEAMDENRVRELYNLVSVPDMEFVGIVNTNGVPTLENGQFLNVNFYPKFLVRNSGSAVEKIFKFELWLLSEFHDANFSPLQNYFNRLEGPYTVFSVPNRQPVFQGEICNILEAKLFVNHENIARFLESEMIIKLYYSRGIKEFTYRLIETFTYNNKYLLASDFMPLVINDNKINNNVL